MVAILRFAVNGGKRKLSYGRMICTGNLVIVTAIVGFEIVTVDRLTAMKLNKAEQRKACRDELADARHAIEGG